MRISDWSSDVCSSDLVYPELRLNLLISPPPPNINLWFSARFLDQANNIQNLLNYIDILITPFFYIPLYFIRRSIRSEEHTSELQLLMRISYAVFCLKTKT